jgi:hypothetical protein|tara:strand:- start:217 stop:555 length:339 start_codon:yes stop_codon:yes gene_type:complete
LALASIVASVALYCGQIAAIMLGSQPDSTAALTVCAEQLSAYVSETAPCRNTKAGSSRKTGLIRNINDPCGGFALALQSAWRNSIVCNSHPQVKARTVPDQKKEVRSQNEGA